MKMITINVKATTIVKPAEETPRGPLWLSNMDIIMSDVHSLTAYFYERNGAANDGFFEAGALKDALAKILVPFYPLAGRLRLDATGRQEVDCNAEGALFVEAETDAAIAHFGDFSPNLEMQKLIPPIDRSGELSSFPILLAQITYFKRGGVALGVAIEHRLADGFSGPNFVNLWSEVARGLDPKTLDPLLDRSFLRARDPPRPAFDHTEYGPFPTLDDQKSSKEPKRDNDCSTEQADASIVTRSFKLNADLINALKEKSKESDSTVNYTTYEILAGHLWKCVCKALALPDGQKSNLVSATSGRARLQPPTPPNFFGNVIFPASVVAKVGDIVSKPSWYATSIIHDSLTRINNNDYLRSALDFLELQPKLPGILRGRFGSPNIGITSWVRLSFYEADFGWGRPIYVGPIWVPYEGKAYILRASGDDNDKTLSVAIRLKSEHMEAFEKLLYEI